MGEVLFVDLESDRHSPLELRTVAETVVRRRLLAVPGVSQVIATGGEQKQYEVVLDPARLAAQQVTLKDVEDALTSANRNATAGFQVTEGQEYLVRGVGRLSGIGAIAAVVVKTTNSTPVLIRDVGTVREGAAIRRGDGSHNARPAVIIGIQKQPGTNTLNLTEQIERTLDDIQRALPAGMQIHRDLFRQADFIEQSLNNLFVRLLEGAGLVVLVFVLFLMNGRAALITLLALPLSLLAAVVVMRWFGLTVNTMSLGGLAIAIGELVDDAIIDVENVARRLRENASQPYGSRVPVLDIVYRASTEIRGSVVFATAIVALVFLPLFTLGSVEGRTNVTGRDLRSVVTDIQARVGRNITIPQAYHVEYGGQFESETQASQQLLWLSLGVVIAIFFILSSAFGSSRDGLLIMVNLPLALIGGVVGVYLSGGVLSVASIVGFITLFGIATRNGIMLVSHIRHLQEHEGVTDLRTAVVRGATERLVPILMTALAAGLALVPIALSGGEPGSEIQAPMAMVIMVGLLSSTALNMLVVPILYERFGRPAAAALGETQSL
jgi:Cu/Ag efflux pump CusA